VDTKLSVLYQLGEDVEDGIEIYYNLHEFKWLDSMAAGFGPDPELSSVGSVPRFSLLTDLITDPRSVQGNVMMDTGTHILSLFGDGSSHITQLAFSSGSLVSATEITPIGSVDAPLCYGAAGYYLGDVFYLFGSNLTVTGSVGLDIVKYNVATNTMTTVGTIDADKVTRDAAFAQFGSKLYIFGGIKQVSSTPGTPYGASSSYFVYDMSSGLLDEYPLPFTCENGTAVSVTEFIYIYTGTQFFKFNTITSVFEEIESTSLTTDLPVMFKRNNSLYILTGSSWSGGFDENTYLEYSLSNAQWSVGEMLKQTTVPVTDVVIKAGRLYGCGNSLGSGPSSVIQGIYFS
jgi:hypothetical protein